MMRLRPIIRILLLAVVAADGDAVRLPHLPGTGDARTIEIAQIGIAQIAPSHEAVNAVESDAGLILAPGRGRDQHVV